MNDSGDPGSRRSVAPDAVAADSPTCSAARCNGKRLPRWNLAYGAESAQPATGAAACPWITIPPPDDVRDQRHHQRLQVSVADVPDRDRQELRRPPLEDVRIHEVDILCGYRSPLPVGRVDNLFCRSSDSRPAGQACGLHRCRRSSATRPHVSAIGHPRGTSRSDRLEPAGPSQPGGMLRNSRQVVALEVLIVGQDFIQRHARTEQLQQ